MKQLISIVVPMFNESQNIDFFYQKMSEVLSDLPAYHFEIICVNDGSRDNTLEKIEQLAMRDKRIKVIELSRNFGKEIALTAGICEASGDAVIPIDADLQDPPELIVDLIKKWHEGYDVVYATRLLREGESSFRKMTAFLFYRIMRRLAKVDIPPDTGDFRLMSRQVVEAVNQCNECHRFMKGLFSWVGFKQTSIPYLRNRRHKGTTSFNYWKLWNFALEGITSFSFVPLQLATYIGFLTALFSGVYISYIIVTTWLFGNPVQGYPSTIVAIFFFGGTQLMTLGIIGEYIGRIYNESKRRPLYFIRKKTNF
ncbi:glycosyltransferase family 2 protein [Sporomusa sp.]|uniref:glycosyltransferase family 2 protein n=1 Tax=Sporomusa sp. TaxID=2078658 RepID=UPI002C76F3F4|nr:glycosyltransferase family 2 protein [Sporomusa sp.]HWR08492.1 glycosyltransferase family 2 protein [Sporomusa sp.]